MGNDKLTECRKVRREDIDMIGIQSDAKVVIASLYKDHLTPSVPTLDVYQVSCARLFSVYGTSASKVIVADSPDSAIDIALIDWNRYCRYIHSRGDIKVRQIDLSSPGEIISEFQID